MLKIDLDKRKEIAKAVEPYIVRVKNGVDHNIIAKEIAQKYNVFSPNVYDENYKNFLYHSSFLFKNEIYFKSCYKGPSDIIGYYSNAGSYLPCILYQIYQMFGEKKVVSSDQLKDDLKAILKNKKVLELGCGPGFALNIMKVFGAIVSGIEIYEEYKDRIPDLGIKYCNANKLDSEFKDKFDIIYSQNFFATAIIDPFESCGIAKKMAQQTNIDGFFIHVIRYEKVCRYYNFFGGWFSAFINGDEKLWYDFYFSVSEEELEQSLYCNKISLSKQSIEDAGFRLLFNQSVYENWIIIAQR